MSVPIEIEELVTHFTANRHTYLNPSYNETSLRNEFLDPFFIALGWDVGNRRKYADAYKDVVLETSQAVEGTARKPDYVFRAGGIQKFFVEAKKPAVNIEADPAPAFQVRRYAWSAKLPLSILTDFEQFAVYECRNKPSDKDPSGTGRIQLLHYTDYLKKWNWLYDTFSCEAVYKGAYDRYTEGIRGKRGTMEVDDAFLKEIEQWRELLARNIALRNPALSTPEMNYAVQMTINRIIFLRICEDREIEPDGLLKTAACSPDIYPALCDLFRQADDRYNSGLFHFRKESQQSSQPDDLSLALKIDDKVLKEIIAGLYYPSPYVFREIPADILGQVYEKFLGKVIRLTPAHQAKVEEKPEVRKAGGVYYTPTYIVDYIVKHTVGELVKEKTPAQVAALKILDPACGSGSFLLGAYQYLLNWHIRYYSEHDPEKWARGSSAAIYPAPGGGWRLTTLEKKRILLNNIHGVDIDPQAVEVTKLSLSLKVLEGESRQTIGTQLSLFKERALPDLARNIRCGNSLIGWDYTEGRLFADEEEKARVNPFDWQTAFPQVFKQGGFDAVIGNPPYGAFTKPEDDYYLSNEFVTYKKTKDVYTCFIEKGINLLKSNGKESFIVPSGWIGGPLYISLRDYLINFKIDSIILLPFDVFSDAYIDTLVYVLEKNKDIDSHDVKTFTFPKKEKIKQIDISEYKSIAQISWKSSKNYKFVINPDALSILNSINKLKPFSDYIKIKRGVLFDKKLLKNQQLTAQYFPYFEGDVYRYQINEKLSHWIEFNEKLKERPKEFYWFSESRILLRRLVNRQQRLMASYTDICFITNKNLYSIISLGIDPFVILGILNSKLLSYLYINQVSQAVKDDFPQVTIKDILELPFPNEIILNQNNDKMHKLVARLIELFRKSGNTPHEKEALQREIAATDRQIDQLVYKLYGLTEEEIKIVEGE